MASEDRGHPGAIRTHAILRWNAGVTAKEKDDITVEEPLEIRVNGDAVAVTMRTPGHDEELAAGFCRTEGIAGHDDEIADVRVCTDSDNGNTIEVTIECGDVAHSEERRQRATRASFLSTSCGVCGKQSLDRIELYAPPFTRKTPMFSYRAIADLTSRVREHEDIFSRTGGLHSAALVDSDANILVVREDIGRHNAVDKVIGHCIFQRRAEVRESSLLLVSGRSSFEILQKAAIGRIPMVAAVSAPSSLAIELAQRLDMTLIGFLRPGRLNVYHDPGRLS